jgi:hypothetical protein
VMPSSLPAPLTNRAMAAIMLTCIVAIDQERWIECGRE